MTVGFAVPPGVAPAWDAAVLRDGEVLYAASGGERSPGRRSPGRESGGAPLAGAPVLFDVASLTKVVATGTLAALLVKEGARARRAGRPTGSRRFRGGGTGRRVTVRHLLAHSSGLPWWRPWFERAAADPVAGQAFLPPDRRPGRPAGTPSPRAGAAWRKRSGRSRSRRRRAPGRSTATRPSWRSGFSWSGPAGRRSTGSSRTGWPGRSVSGHLLRRGPGGWRWGGAVRRAGYAPTERCAHRGEVNRGAVNDDNAWAIGGVAGHAGLFSTAADVARLGQAWLDALAGRGRILDGAWPASSRGATLRRARRRAGTSSRALGWDTPQRRGRRSRWATGSAAGPAARSATSASPGARSGSTSTGAGRCALLTNHVHPDGRRPGADPGVAAGLPRRGGRGGGGMTDEAADVGMDWRRREAGPPHRRLRHRHGLLRRDAQGGRPRGDRVGRERLPAHVDPARALGHRGHERLPAPRTSTGPGPTWSSSATSSAQVNPEAAAMRERGLPHVSFPAALGERFIGPRHGVVVVGHPRQDHHQRHDGPSCSTTPAATRPSWSAASPATSSRNYRLGGGAALRGRGGRVRHRLLRQGPQVPPLPAAHRHLHQLRARPRRHLPGRGALRERLRAVRRRSCRPTASWPPAPSYPSVLRISPRGPAAGSRPTRWTRPAPTGRRAASRSAPTGPASRLVRARARPRRRCTSPVGGAHNVENALGVAAAATALGLSPAEIAAGLAAFRGREAAPGGARRAPAASPWSTTSPTTRRAVREDAGRHPGPLPGGAAAGLLRAALQHQPAQPPPGRVRRRGHLERRRRRSSCCAPRRPTGCRRRSGSTWTGWCAELSGRGTPAAAFATRGRAGGRARRAARPGDVVVAMSNGAFGGIWTKLLAGPRA